MKVKKTKGMTLIELVITMGILSIILGVITIMFTANSKVFSKIDLNSELQLEGEMIQRELMKILPESQGIIDINFDTEGVEGEIISFTVGDKLYNHRFLLDNKEFYYQKLDLEEGKILNERILSSNVDSIKINPQQEAEILTSKSVEFKIRLVKKKGTQEIEYEIDNYILFRNFK